MVITTQGGYMDYLFLSSTLMFRGCSPEEIRAVLELIKYRTRSFEKDSIIYHTGDTVTEIGLVLSGSVQMEATNLFGDRSILGVVPCGDTFAGSYACSPDQPILVDVVARENSQILFIQVESLFEAAGQHHCIPIIVRNLLTIAAKKNFALTLRIFHSTPRKIRDRLSSFFSEQMTMQNSNHVIIPFDRQQLADYLGVERTALSKELAKMKSDGLIDYYKNEFDIHV